MNTGTVQMGEPSVELRLRPEKFNTKIRPLGVLNRNLYEKTLKTHLQQCRIRSEIATAYLFVI
jgi:hypothetical protein